MEISNLTTLHQYYYFTQTNGVRSQRAVAQIEFFNKSNCSQ